MFPCVVETRVEVWGNSKLRGNTFTRVSITLWKHRKCFLYGYIIKEIENIPPCLPIRYRYTRGSLGLLRDLQIAWKHSPCGLVFPTSISQIFSQTPTRVSITEWKHRKCFLFFKYVWDQIYRTYI